MVQEGDKGCKEWTEMSVRALQPKCQHLGKVSPAKFQCGDYEDTADKCNCLSCMSVFCQQCNNLIFISCDTVRETWRKTEVERVKKDAELIMKDICPRCKKKFPSALELRDHIFICKGRKGERHG